MLRQSKNDHSNVAFFGKCLENSCIFMDYVFKWDRTFRFYLDSMYAVNIHTGKSITCDWLGKGYVASPGNGKRKYVMQDTINDVHEANGHLIFNISRKKSAFFPTKCYPDDYDFDTNYTLSVSLENNVFKAVRSFLCATPKPGISARFCLPKTFVTNSPVKQDNAATQPAQKSVPSVPQVCVRPGKLGSSFLVPADMLMKLPPAGRLSCENMKSSGKCNNQCIDCVAKAAPAAIMKVHQQLPDLAISQLSAIISKDPSYAEIWLYLGKAYLQKEDYASAISSFNRAIELLPLYGEPYLYKAIALAGIGKNIEAYKLTKAILSVCDDPGAKCFLRTLPQERLKALGLEDPILSREKAASRIQTNIQADSTSNEDY